MGGNCAFVHCRVDHKRKKDRSLSTVPSDQLIRDKWIQIICASRELDQSLRERLEKNTVKMCDLHFSAEQFLSIATDTDGGKYYTMNKLYYYKIYLMTCYFHVKTQ